jgi:nucleoside-diphosphate-sugar epimerase
MALHVVVGSGPIGTATTHALVESGHKVRVVTRSGGGPDHPAVERVAADASDPERLTALAAGAHALYNCANPRYFEWPKVWPPLAAAMLTAAERSGAGLVTMSNLYVYGPVTVPMTEQLPLAAKTRKGSVRARMWADALRAHEAGRVRVTEARASDFVGPGARSMLSEMVLPAVRAGKRAYAPADFDVVHSLTYTGDVGRMMAVLGTDDRAWGRAWHVPTPPAETIREIARRYARLTGAPAPRLATMPRTVLRAGGMFNPTAREFVEMQYQFTRPFVLDSSAAERTFGLTPTTLDAALATMV